MIKKSYLALAYAFLYLPLLLLIAYSFLDKQHHLTWQWYRVLLNDENILTVTYNSLLVAILSASIATILGTIATIILTRYHFFGRKWIGTILFSYIIIPDLVIGISLLLLAHVINLPLGLLTLLIGHITLCLPFVSITINSRLHDFDANLFSAAKDLGASEAILFYRIFLPLLFPALLAAWLLSFTLSMDDVIISYFLTGPSFQVLPLYIYSLVRLGLTPEINAICSIIFFATLLLILLSQLALRKR